MTMPISPGPRPDDRVVVVGHGPAAHRLVELLTRRGHRGRITVLGAEPVPAYTRPLLSAVLDGSLPGGALTLPAAGAAVVHTGVRATRIDRECRLVHADDGSRHPYDRLVLAVGAAPVVPETVLPGQALPGHGLAGHGLHGPPGRTPPPGPGVLRTLADCLAVGPGPVVLIGGSLLAVEAGLALRRSGREVALVHRGGYPLDRYLDARAGGLLTARLTAAGLDLHLGRTVADHADGKLTLDDGQVVAAEQVLLATGVRPRTGLARRAGLPVAEGVLVDERLTTTDPRVYALGDCAQPATAATAGTSGRSGRSGTSTASGSPARTSRGAGAPVPAGEPFSGHATAWDQAAVLAELLSGGTARFTGSRAPVRLKARELDLVCLGSPEDAEETVVLSDAGGTRYGRLSLRGNRLCGAVLFGLGQAAATVARLYERDEPLPADRLALLLGSAPGYADAGPVGQGSVCHCNNVTGEDLAEAWRAGSRTPEALASATRATTGCGGCAGDVRRLCALFAEREPQRKEEDEG
ncbi:FAD-dependent oxidoreductase [Streptomyces sp. NPDC012888]|uniref:FAD-dependent oxidoreductase n=1 Tax=Streptomyces sp. NPDC012888 TaxID=3364855 RepID=UPI00369C18CE